MREFEKENFVRDEDEAEKINEQSDQLEAQKTHFSGAESNQLEGTETDTEPHFSVDEQLLPDQLIYENDIIAEQEIDALPEPIVIEGLVAELEAVENDLDISSVNDSILADQELTIQDIVESWGDKETIVLDFGSSTEQECIETNEGLSSGHDQVQQLLFEPLQEQQESEQVACDQAISDPLQHVEPEEVEQNSQPISDEEWAEQEQASLEILESSPDMRAQIAEVIGEKTLTQEKLDQLIRDYQASLEQDTSLDEASSSDQQHEVELDQQTSVTSENAINEAEIDNNLDGTQQEGVSDSIFDAMQENSQCLTNQETEQSGVTKTDLEERSNELELPIQEQQSNYIQESSIQIENPNHAVEGTQPILSIKSETHHTVEDLISRNDVPSVFSKQETISIQLSSELCLADDSLASVIDITDNDINNVPNITDNDIEISCYTLTAHMEKENIFVIEGEELVRQVPASKVLPYAGLSARSDSQVYEQIRGINKDMKRKD